MLSNKFCGLGRYENSRLNYAFKRYEWGNVEFMALTRFVEEVSNSRGERYPSRSLYLIICGIRRYLREENDLDPLSKDDRRLVLMSLGIIFVVLLINRK